LVYYFLFFFLPPVVSRVFLCPEFVGEEDGLKNKNDDESTIQQQ
jgi:hypothetical protein